jgi:hypothetical protein
MHTIIHVYVLIFKSLERAWPDNLVAQSVLSVSIRVELHTCYLVPGLLKSGTNEIVLHNKVIGFKDMFYT